MTSLQIIVINGSQTR